MYFFKIKIFNISKLKFDKTHQFQKNFRLQMCVTKASFSEIRSVSSNSCTTSFFYQNYFLSKFCGNGFFKWKNIRDFTKVLLKKYGLLRVVIVIHIRPK